MLRDLLMQLHGKHWYDLYYIQLSGVLNKINLAALNMIQLLSNISDINSYNTRTSQSGDLRVPNARLNTKIENSPM